MKRAAKTLVDARVNDLVNIILDGAVLPFDLCEFVREQEKAAGSPWFLAEGDKPLSYSQIRRYAARAQTVIEDTTRTSRKRLLRTHVAQRRHLYAKAVNQGDLRAAAGILKDLAELQGLYPARGVEVRGNVGGVIALQVVEEIVVRCPPPALEHVPAEANTNVNGSPHTAAGVPPAQAGQAAPGTTGVPPQ
jgi:hypothetical protein